MKTFANLWAWALNTNGMVQIVVVLGALALSGFCYLLVRRHKLMHDNGGEPTSVLSTIVDILLIVAGIICDLIALLFVAAVFAPLFGLH